MKEKNKKILLIVSILLVTIGTTLAYFVARSLSEGNGISTTVSTVTVGSSTLRVEGTLEFDDADIYPGHTVASAIKVVATGDNELIPYHLIWEGQTEISGLNYTVYKTSSNINVHSTCEKKNEVVNNIKQYFEECSTSNIDSLGSPIATGRITKGDTKVRLVEDEFITATSTGTTWYYYVIIEYPNLDVNQKGDANAIFDGKVTVEKSNKEPDIKILAIKVEQEDGSYRDEDEIPTTGYKLVQNKSQCSNDAVPNYDSENKRFYADNLTKSGTTCYLTFDILKPQTSETIIAAIKGTNVYKGDSATPTFTSVATGDGTSSTDNSGVYRVADPMYKTTDNQNPMSYYFRGAVKNNYVKFGGKCWRIVRINGDGSIRLIYDGTTCHANGTSTAESIAKTSIKYNNSYNNSAYVGWTYSSGNQRPSTAVPQTSGTASNIKTVTENWFNSDAGFTTEQKAQVVTGKFCNDRATKNNEAWRATGNTQYYAAYARINEGTKTPTLACSDGDIYHSQVGLITADEVQFAGASGTTNNTSYYLYNGQYYWTMSPNRWNSNYAYVFIVHENGSLYYWNVDDTTPAVRPVINLKADTLFAENGDGSQSNPYVVQ